MFQQGFNNRLCPEPQFLNKEKKKSIFASFKKGATMEVFLCGIESFVNVADRMVELKISSLKETQIK